MPDTLRWPPLIADHVRIIATGERGLVMDLLPGGHDLKIVVAIYPTVPNVSDAGAGLVLGTLLEQRLFNLDDLAP
jgi:hypothetical protein